MNAQLMLLLELQDLKSQHKTMTVETGVEQVEAEHFGIDTSDAANTLEEKIGELRGQLEGSVRSRYERISGSLERVVVPVINGVCYGCFVSIPTATYRDQDPNKDVHACQNCGRFIYILN